MTFFYRFMTFSCLCFFLFACSNESPVKGKVITLQSKPVLNTLFYSGIIQPLQTLVVTSPADGVVLTMPFQYGEMVKAGQLLFTLSSTKFSSDYKAALMAYIKAKNDFNTAQTQLTEAKFLHKNELISDDDFKSKQSNFYSAQLALLQAKDNLQNFMQQIHIKNIDLYNLTIADIDKITQALHLQNNADQMEQLRVVAPRMGTILAPNKNDDENKKITAGDAVKQGDVLAVIGDRRGLSVRIKVNELTVNQLKIGQKVTLTGIAFPDHVLMGNINRVDRQGETTAGGLPTFSVQIIVPKLTPEQQKQIHIGMSVKVEITIEDEPTLMLPLSALIEKNGQTYVLKRDNKTGKWREVLVKTGKTTLDSVGILSGLKVGDQVVIPN